MDHDFPLGTFVALHGSVPVEVIGGQIHYDGPVRTSRDGAQMLELEGREFEDDPIFGFDVSGVFDQRPSDIASHPDAGRRLLKDFGDQRGGRGFSVRSGDAQDPSGAASFEEQVHLRFERDAGFDRGPEIGRVVGDAGIDDDEIGGGEIRRVMFAEPEANGKVVQRPNRFFENVFGAEVGDGDARALLGEEAGDRDAASKRAQSHDGDARAAKVGVGTRKWKR